MKNKEQITDEVIRICEFLGVEGWASYDELREGVKDENMIFLEKAIVVLKISMKEVTETRAGTPKKQGLQLTAKKITKKRIQEVLREGGLLGGRSVEKAWKDWAELTMTIKFRTPCLSGMPFEGGIGDEKRNMFFDRFENGDLMFRSGHWRGLLGKIYEWLDDFPKYGKNKIMFDPHPVKVNGQIYKQTRICPDGKGFTYHEALKEGSELKVDIMLPTSRCSVEDFANLMARAGKFSGFSIAGSTQGFGKFDVIGVEVMA